MNFRVAIHDNYPNIIFLFQVRCEFLLLLLGRFYFLPLQHFRYLYAHQEKKTRTAKK